AATHSPTSPPPRRPVRDRVVELVRVPAGELRPNPHNWRRHPQAQRAALRSLLHQIGYADALLARREGHSLVLIDGHLRQSLDPHQSVPVLVLDVTEEEADTLLATLDPLAALATSDSAALADLLGRVEASSQAVADLLAKVAREAGLPVRRVLVDPDAVPGLTAIPRTRRGRRWKEGGQRVLLGADTCAAHGARCTAGGVMK